MFIINLGRDPRSVTELHSVTVTFVASLKDGQLFNKAY